MSIALIGGTGLNELEGFSVTESKSISTPYGAPSTDLLFGTFANKDVIFLPRHGHPHKLAPHMINYRANLWALKHVGVEQVLAVNAVGGIHEAFPPAGLAIPDQVIDYTYGREHTLYDDGQSLDHIDFTYPYDQAIRERLITLAQELGLNALEHGVYAVTQGPRLETAAEVSRIRRDGGDMIGMTGMPEASLARELGLRYACVALSVNWCAGMTPELITMDDIRKALDDGMSKVLSLLSAYLQQP